MKKRFLPLLMFMLLASAGFAQTHHTLLVTVPDSVEVVFVAGEFNNWNPTADSMHLVSTLPRQYSFDYTWDNNLVDTMEFKYIAGPVGWGKYEQNGANLVAGTDSVAEITFKAVWHSTYAKDVKIDVLVPTNVYELYITGTFNNWAATENQMEKIDSTENGKEFTATIHTLDTTTLEFKFLAGPGWPYQQEHGNWNYMTDGGTLTVDLFKKIYDPTEAGDITINITVPPGTPDVYLIGSWGANWSLEEAVHATKVNDTTWTAVVPNVADIDYKVYNWPDWTYEEAADAEGSNVADRHASFISGPTFDIKVLFWKAVHEVPTGIDNISKTLKMYSVNSTIVVEDVKGTVTVFDINGRMLQSVQSRGTFVSRTLQPGIYIIRVDNKAQKIAVR
jgi:hypothetical protein